MVRARVRATVRDRVRHSAVASSSVTSSLTVSDLRCEAGWVVKGAEGAGAGLRLYRAGPRQKSVCIRSPVYLIPIACQAWSRDTLVGATGSEGDTDEGVPSR